MGKSDNLLLDGVKGSIGNVTICEMDGETIMKQKITSKRDAKTPKQLEQRAKMKMVAGLSKLLVSYSGFGFCSKSRRHAMNGFNSCNIKHMIIDNKDKKYNAMYDPGKLILSEGTLGVPKIEAEIDEEEREILFQWKKQPLMPNMSKDDNIHFIAFETICFDYVGKELGTRVADGKYKYEICIEDFDPANIVVYAFAVSSDMKKCSNSICLAMGSAVKDRLIFTDLKTQNSKIVDINSNVGKS